MNIHLVPILASLGATVLDGANPAIEGPIFDNQGQYIVYNYADGTNDWYTYDDNWRLVLFEGRDGTTTGYIYSADGTMRVESAP